ncbi:MAG: hypothetical protein MUE60_09235 [Candidatus Eisenbacteria bacterium]|jgi:uncharacterized membrane protein YeaQ/YmgE (transglycosylase-associated protein family)|nr:hypothetical protein [Candidatus Eisenbacteria bacterium]
MSTTIGFGVLVAATVLMGWLAEEVLPRRPTGGLKGLITLGLVSGFSLGWFFEALHIGRGPSPGGINLVAGLVGSMVSILAASLAVALRAPRGQA